MKSRSRRAAVTLVLLAAAVGALPAGAAAQAAGGEVVVPLRVQAGRLAIPVRTPSGQELTFALGFGHVEPIVAESRADDVAGAPVLVGSLPVLTEAALTRPDVELGHGGERVDGAIGVGFLSQFDVLVDVPGGRLVLKPVGRPAVWEGTSLGPPVRLRLLHGVVVTMDVDVGGRTYGAMLDLGQRSLVVNPAAGAELGIEGTGKVALGLGGRTQAGLPAEVQDLEIFRRFRPNGGGFVLVGVPAVAACAMSISWVHQELRMCAP